MTDNTESSQPPAQLRTLAEKLNGLDLTADEERALGALLGVQHALEDGAETQGFGWEEGVAAVVGRPHVQIRGFNIGMPPSTSISAELGAGFVNEKP